MVESMLRSVMDSVLDKGPIAMLFFLIFMFVAIPGLIAIVIFILGSILRAGAKKGVDSERKKSGEIDLDNKARQHGLSPDVTVCIQEHGKLARAADQSAKCETTPPAPSVITRIAVDCDARKLFLTMVDMAPGWPMKKTEGVYDFEDVRAIERDSVTRGADRSGAGTHEEKMPAIRLDFADEHHKSGWIVVSAAEGLNAARIDDGLRAALRGEPEAGLSGRATKFAGQGVRPSLQAG